MAHYPLVTTGNVCQMEYHLGHFHRLMEIFVQNGTQGLKKHLQIPKLHALVHYIENSYQLGIPNNFSMETPESLHIKMCKDPYKASNHQEVDQQILSYLDIQDWLTLQHFYEGMHAEITDLIYYYALADLMLLYFRHPILRIGIVVLRCLSYPLLSSLRQDLMCAQSQYPNYTKFMAFHSLPPQFVACSSLVIMVP